MYCKRKYVILIRIKTYAFGEQILHWFHEADCRLTGNLQSGSAEAKSAEKMPPNMYGLDADQYKL